MQTNLTPQITGLVAGAANPGPITVSLAHMLVIAKAAPKKDHRLVLMSVFVQQETTGTVRLVATDGKILAKRIVTMSDDDKAFAESVTTGRVPVSQVNVSLADLKTLAAIVKGLASDLLRFEAELTDDAKAKVFAVTMSGVSVPVEHVEGKFPEVDVVIPHDDRLDFGFCVDPNVLHRFSDLARACSPDRTIPALFIKMRDAERSPLVATFETTQGPETMERCKDTLAIMPVIPEHKHRHHLGALNGQVLVDAKELAELRAFKAEHLAENQPATV